jgi:hypothetical protein
MSGNIKLSPAQQEAERLQQQAAQALKEYVYPVRVIARPDTKIAKPKAGGQS